MTEEQEKILREKILRFSNPVQEILKASAADLLEQVADGFQSGQYAWVQGEYETTRGPKGYCSIGALRHFGMQVNVIEYAEDAYRDVVFDRVRDNLRLRTIMPDGIIGLTPSNGIVIHFNDKIAKNVDDVVDVMKHAAKDLRNQS